MDARRIPTTEVYKELQEAYNHFNKRLFDNSLPDCLITLQREKLTVGYFSHTRFVRRSGEQTDEIAMNPSYFGVRTVKATLSTLVHEMVHLWQFHNGKPGRRGYHNKEWANAMERIGLMPSDTGSVGGRRVGERMSHYIIPTGQFDIAVQELLTSEFTLNWFDRFPPISPNTDSIEPAGSTNNDKDDSDDNGNSDDEDLPLSLIELPTVEAGGKSNRSKYKCPSCNAQLWGKPGLLVLCGIADCNSVQLMELDARKA